MDLLAPFLCCSFIHFNLSSFIFSLNHINSSFYVLLFLICYFQLLIYLYLLFSDIFVTLRSFVG